MGDLNKSKLSYILYFSRDTLSEYQYWENKGRCEEHEGKPMYVSLEISLCADAVFSCEDSPDNFLFSGLVTPYSFSAFLFQFPREVYLLTATHREFFH